MRVEGRVGRWRVGCVRVGLVVSVGETRWGLDGGGGVCGLWRFVFVEIDIGGFWVILGVIISGWLCG